MTNRLTSLRVRGLRTLADVTLDLSGFSVLIGDNGSGKSSLIEALEILRRIGSHAEALGDLATVHGGVAQLLRYGSSRLSFDVSANASEGQLDYSLTLIPAGPAFAVESESLDLRTKPHGEPLHVIIRRPGVSRVFDQAQRRLVDISVLAHQVLLSSFGVLPPQPAILRMCEFLKNIRVHVRFDTTPNWVNIDAGRPRSAMRSSIVLQPSEGITRLGGNLANAWFALHHEFGNEHWQDTIEYVRLGLGAEIENVNVRADPGGGNIGLLIKYRGLPDPVPSYALSDGTLAFLAFVALVRLKRSETLIAFDEPETHLHPLLLARVVEMFDEVSENCPVLLTTHSDRLLDSLSDPSKSVVLCALTAERTTSLVRPNPAELKAWLGQFRGLGQIRAEGYESQIFRDASS